MDPPPIRFAGSGGGQIRYWELGDGPTLLHLSLPGLDFDEEWERLDVAGWFERLGQRFRLCRVSVPQSAATVTSPEARTELIERLDLVLDALGADHAALVGVAHAVPQALVYAAARPARTTHLMLWNGYANGATYAATSALYQIRGVRRIDRDLFRRMVALARGAQSWEELDDPLSHRLATEPPERWEAMWEGFARIDVREDAAAVEAPVLCYHASATHFVGFEAVREMAGLLGQVSLRRPRDCGYQPWSQRPQTFVDQLADFMGLATPSARFADHGPPIRLILFTDVEASTELTGRLGDGEARALLREHERLTREALAAHGGAEIKTMGDGFMASFTSASGALDAAIAMQRAITAHFAETQTPIRIRVGINAGEPIEEDDDLHGTAVIQAARVMGKADGGQILVTDTVRNLVAGKNYRFSDHGTHDLKGFEESVRLFEVGWSASD